MIFHAAECYPLFLRSPLGAVCDLAVPAGLLVSVDIFHGHTGGGASVPGEFGAGAWASEDGVVSSVR